MKFGLVGTGPWARMTHGPGLVHADGIELVGVWGRNPQETDRFAADPGAPPSRNYSPMLNDVEAVASAVPPAVQAEMAIDAAAAEKPLLLDNPITADLDTARALHTAAA